MRWPISPGHGGTSRPGRSFWNLTHLTVRPLLLVIGLSSGLGGPPHIAMSELYPAGADTDYLPRLGSRVSRLESLRGRGRTTSPLLVCASHRRSARRSGLPYHHRRRADLLRPPD